MKYVDEFRDPLTAQHLAEKIRGRVAHRTNHQWRIMEVCGGQTHSILRFGIDQMLPSSIELLHGPGCPVCVTPIERIDQAVEIAKRPGVILCSFGDMLRVPGTQGDLLSARAEGAEVRVVYSPMDSLKIARENPEKQVVFFAVGFETTAPANAMTVYQASRFKISNFSILASQVLVPPAMEAVLRSSGSRVQGFLAAGHVCTIMGYKQYESLAEKYQVPIVVTGFEPIDILQGILMCVSQLEKGASFVENQYSRSVRRDGNRAAIKILEEVFEVTQINWRGMGEIQESGLRLKAKFEAYDADLKFLRGIPRTLETTHEKELGVTIALSSPENSCISGKILNGMNKPPDCSEFGKNCTPDTPLGVTMVSHEGACAAYYQYRLHE